MPMTPRHLDESQLVKHLGWKPVVAPTPSPILAPTPSMDSKITGSDITITCWLNDIGPTDFGSNDKVLRQ